MLILAEQPGVASQNFATPGYKSVALRAIKSAGTLALLLHIRRHNELLDSLRKEWGVTYPSDKL